MEEFCLPEHWNVRITSENIDLIAKWRLDTFNYNSILDVNYYVYYDGSYNAFDLILTEITTEQFIKYVLKEYIFPEDNWCIKIKDEYIATLNEYNNNTKHERNGLGWSMNSVFLTKSGYLTDYDSKVGFEEITIKQFKEYVLKESIIKEDHSYLIEFLKKLNIK